MTTIRHFAFPAAVRKLLGFALAASILALSGSFAQAAPIATYVAEVNTAAGGTSYLKLPLLQSNGTIIPTDENVFVGSLNIGVENTLNGPLTNFLAFCVDPWNWGTSSALPYFKDTVGQMLAIPNATTDISGLISHQAQIASLYSNFYQGTLGNNAHAAAFQLALWEIVSDNGVLKASSGTNDTIWSDGQSLLASLNSIQYAQGSQHYVLTAYYADRSKDGILGQNYVVATAVPEPATLLLFGLGLLGLALMRRRSA